MKAVIWKLRMRGGVYEFKSAPFSSQSTSEAKNVRSIRAWVESYEKFKIFEKSCFFWSGGALKVGGGGFSFINL